MDNEVISFENEFYYPVHSFGYDFTTESVTYDLLCLEASIVTRTCELQMIRDTKNSNK